MGQLMNITEIQIKLQELTNGKVTQTDIAHALNKDRSNINTKAKKGTELKLSEIRQIEEYFNVNLTTNQHQNNNKSNINDIKQVILTVEEYYKENNITTTPEQKAEVLSLVIKCVERILNQN